MSLYREQLASALDAVSLRAPLTYVWLGRRGRTLPRALQDAFTDAERRTFLRDCVAGELYWSFYCRGRVEPARWREAQAIVGDPQLRDAIVAAAGGRGSRLDGWTVARVDDEDAVLDSGRLRMRVPVNALEGTPHVGTAMSVWVPSVRPQLSPGFVTVTGDAGDVLGPRAVRVYWHVTAAGAPVLVSALAPWLNAEGVPFRLKLTYHPLEYDRADAAVLYLRAETFCALRDSLAVAGTRLAPFLRPRVPAFTLPLTGGVGLAEDDGAAESFGERRCRLLADGILAAYGVRGSAARLAVLIETFQAAGIDVDAPYREPAMTGGHVL